VTRRPRYDPDACPLCRTGTVPLGRRIYPDCLIDRMYHRTKQYAAPTGLRSVAGDLGRRVFVPHPVDFDRAVRAWEDGR
jgi:hypothetical protein